MKIIGSIIILIQAMSAAGFLSVALLIAAGLVALAALIYRFLL